VPSESDGAFNPKRYWSFISYSHADRAWADWLHKSLERYRIPRRLVGVTIASGPVPSRIAPVFLDRVELAATTDLDATIAEALRSSRSLIVICSPAATRSPRVTQEIELFGGLKSGRLLCLIVAGRPNAEERGGSAAEECFPLPLRGSPHVGTTDSAIPLAADVRPGKGGRQEALLKLVAGILNVNLDQLRQRDSQRRRLWWVAATAICLTGMMCASALALYAWGQRNAAVQAESGLLIQSAAQHLNDSNVAGAQDTILEVLTNPRFAERHTPTAISVFQEIRAADAQIAVLSGHGDIVYSAAYSPDGTRVVTASDDKTARIWDASTGASLAVLSGHSDRVYSAAYSPDGTRIVTASWDKTARIWDARTHAQLAVLSGHGGNVYSAAYSPDGTRIVTASWDKTARIWDARSGKPLSVLSGHTDIVYSAAYSPDGRRVVTASQDKTARIWDAGLGEPLAVLSGHRDRVYSAAYSPDGMHIVTASWDKTAMVWDARTGAQLAELSGPSDRVQSAAYSRDGTRIVTASWDKTARIWDAHTGAPLAVLSGHSDIAYSAAYSPDGMHIVTASWDKTARIWDARPNAQLGVLSDHDDHVNSAAYSPNGMHIVTASDDKTARIWDARTGAPLAVLSGHSGIVYFATYSPDGMRIVTASYDKTARIWDARTGAPLAVLSGHSDRVYCAAYSPDGSRIVTASYDRTARIWDARSGKPLAVLSGHGNVVESATYSPDSARIVTASWDKTARIWDARTGTPLAVLSGHSDRVNSAAYSPDGTRIVTTSDDKTARIWDARTGALLAVLSGHGDFVESAAYSPDGTHIVTASSDKTARVWDARSGVPLAVLSGHDDHVNSAAYSSDGSLIVTASDDKTARIWNAHVPASVGAQILWDASAETDSLSDIDRARLGLPHDSHARTWSTQRSACDEAAAALYDPDRLAPGVAQSDIDADIAIPACLAEIAKPGHAARSDYQMGRALLAKHDVKGATRQLELAVSKGYRAARVDLGDLLVNVSMGMPKPEPAIALYEKAWQSGVPIAAFRLGYLYEFGGTRGTGAAAVAKLAGMSAWIWYERGADVGEPNALARFAERDESSALAENNPSRRNAILLRAFGYYAAAAERAHDEDWPDEAWRHWRYRRASLARLLAREGMMQQVADAYRKVQEGGG